MPVDLFKHGFEYPKDIINPPKGQKQSEEKEVVCRGCGNPDVFTNCKCFYCKRIYRGQGNPAPRDYEFEIKAMEELARLIVPWVPIGGRFIDDEPPEETHPLQSRERIIDRLFKKWKGALQ